MFSEAKNPHSLLYLYLLNKVASYTSQQAQKLFSHVEAKAECLKNYDKKYLNLVLFAETCEIRRLLPNNNTDKDLNKYEKV